MDTSEVWYSDDWDQFNLEPVQYGFQETPQSLIYATRARLTHVPDVFLLDVELANETTTLSESLEVSNLVDDLLSAANKTEPSLAFDLGFDRYQRLHLPLLPWDPELDVIFTLRKRKFSITKVDLCKLAHLDPEDYDETQLQDKVNATIGKERQSLAIVSQSEAFLSDVTLSTINLAKCFPKEHELTGQLERQPPPPQPLTPPLSPRPFDTTKDICSLDLDLNDLDLPLLSLLNDEVEIDVVQVQDIYEQNDNISSSSLQELSNASSLIDEIETALTSGLTNPESDLQVEVPLLTMDSHYSQNDIDVAKQDCFDAIKNRSGLKARGIGLVSSDITLPDFFTELAAHAADAVEQERLLPADSAIRADVPIVSWPPCVPPWRRDEKIELSAGIKRPWTGIATLERSLTWRPMPTRLAAAALQEELEKDSGHFKDLTSVVEIEPDCWKANDSQGENKVLRILSHHKDVDFALVDYGEFDDAERGMDYIVRKRKEKQPGAGEQTTAKRPKTNKKINKDEIDQADGILSLERYLALKGVTINEKLDPRIAAQEEAVAREQENEARQAQYAAQRVEQMAYHRVNITSPSDLPKRCIMVSSEFLRSQRPLYKKLIIAYPGCIMIERDHVYSSQAVQPSSTDAIEETSRVLEDADITLSPSTGILMTNISSIQQRGLPGSGANSGMKLFYPRLRRIAERYEKLIVLISHGCEGIATTHGPSGKVAREFATSFIAGDMDIHASLAIASLAAFADTLSTKVTIRFLLGGDTNLASWLSRYIAAQGSCTKLEEDESLWEQLLRRMGLNAYAATVILTALKKPDNSGGDDFFGLSAFLAFNSKDRMEKFREILGGRRVLSRVNQCIAREWLSQSDGFRMAGGI